VPLHCASLTGRVPFLGFFSLSLLPVQEFLTLPPFIPETKFSIAGFPERKFYPPCDPKREISYLAAPRTFDSSTCN